MRCFFHFVSCNDSIRDADGLEVADLDQALEDAVETLQSLAREDEEAAATWKDWRLEVCDAAGTVLFSISLDQPASVH
jgi:hypothetical protein